MEEEIIFYDNYWQEKCPEKYELFRKWYVNKALTLQMAYIKGIRRHGIYPHEGLCPVYDLVTGQPIMGFLFTKRKKGNEVTVHKFTPEMSSTVVANDINAAWKLYFSEIERTMSDAKIHDPRRVIPDMSDVEEF